MQEKVPSPKKSNLQPPISGATAHGRNPKQPPGMKKNPVNKWDFNYQPQLVSLPDF